MTSHFVDCREAVPYSKVEHYNHKKVHIWSFVNLLVGGYFYGALYSECLSVEASLCMYMMSLDVEELRDRQSGSTPNARESMS